MSESSDKSPLEAFLERYWKDREVGVQRSLDEYIEMFPGDAEGLATEFLGLRRAHNAESTTPVADRKDPTTVDRLGPYALEQELGRGAQGVVYKATNTRTGGNVAVKVLRGVGPGADELLLRFKREAQAAAKADHPGVCAVYDAEIDSGVPYIAMRYVEGETLAKRIARTREEAETKDELSTVVQLDEVDFEDQPDTARDSTPSSSGPRTRAEIMRAVRLVEKAARALHAVHEAGVIHRDVKPGNVMITPEGEAVVMDFGLARDEESDSQTLTRSGDLFGTPAYMSPEQLTRQSIRLDRRTDVWSLGVMLYECVTLTRPFQAPSREGLYRQILAKEPDPPRRINSSIPRDLSTVIATALEKDCDRRYQTALDLAEELRRVRTYEPITARIPAPWTRSARWAQRNPAAALAIVALVAGAAVSLTFAVRADNEATAAQDYLDKLSRLADRQRLRRLVLKADELWPALPEKVADMEAWLSGAQALSTRIGEFRSLLASVRTRAEPWTSTQQRLDRESRVTERTELAAIEAQIIEFRHKLARAKGQLQTIDQRIGRSGDPLNRRDEQRRDQLEEQRAFVEETVLDAEQELSELQAARAKLTATLDERLTWTFQDLVDQVLHDGLLELVRGIGELEGPEDFNVTIASVQRRYRFAREVYERTVTEHSEAWLDAADRVSRDPRFRGLQLSPQVGLVPLGPDPLSKLEEFAHLQTGELPTRDASTGQLILSVRTGLVLVLVPGGSFTMGAQADDAAASNYDQDAGPMESPPNQVTLGPFFLSKYEMTEAQWVKSGRELTRRDKTHLERRGRRPMYGVSWTACQRTLRQLALVLPSEAQWEYACRAGRGTRWWTGREAESLQGASRLQHRSPAQTSDMPVFVGKHAPVGSYRPNPFGLHDTHGNVFEWCKDWWSEYTTPARPGDGLRGVDPSVSVVSGNRIYRGGGYRSTPSACRSTCRHLAGPDEVSDMIGVRPARQVQPLRR